MNKSEKKKKLEYGEYFNITETGGKKTGQCKLCLKLKINTVIKMANSGTSGSSKHLLLKHPKIANEFLTNMSASSDSQPVDQLQLTTLLSKVNTLL